MEKNPIHIGDMIGSNLNIGTVYGDMKSEANINESQKQNLAEAAAEIQQLLEQLSKTYDPPDDTKNKLAIATETVKAIESDPALKSRVISALKSGGIEAFKELLDNPAVNIFMASIEGWNNPE
ncbi:MAG: hypothetical protein AAGA60_25635 [Cyanobacteria bacterium P01_E01_bin.42]